MAQRVRKGLANWLTSSTTPIFVLDHRRVILVFNQGCVDLTGRDPSEIIGKTCQRVTNPNHLEIESITGVLAPPERVFNGESASMPAVIPTATGPYPVEISFFPIPQIEEQENFRIMGVIGALKDSGIELVPESEIRRFDLALILNQIYHEHQLDSLVAHSPEMKRVACQIEIARSHTYPIHIVGAKGTGKNYLARLLHYSSANASKRFVPLDCQKLTHFEISRTLRRLFTDSEEEHHAGTVYLKNIDHLAMDLQLELLNHLEESSTIRWISSSLHGIQELSEKQILLNLKEKFSAFRIELPTLRERSDDLLLLATYFLEKFNLEQNKNIEHFANELEAELGNYHWPGNVSELESVIQHLVTHCETDIAQVGDLSLQFNAGRDAQQTRPLRIGESLENYLNRIEREKITEVLELTQGNKMAAAEVLQMTRAKLYRRIEILEIE